MLRITPVRFYAGALAVLFSCGAATQIRASQLTPEYTKWLNEDVRWIISSQERNDFLQLGTDAARDKFVVDFWERRNPNPGSNTNSFKEEHYRRLAFANQHFAARVPGWRTDRGRTYIVFGPPDRIESGFTSFTSHQMRLRYDPWSPPTTASSNGSKRPYEVWHYNHLKGFGDDQDIKFVDVCSCGDYSMATQ